MKLVEPLVAGISNAPSGSVVFYSRGTANIATTYATFEGGTPSTAPSYPLDAYGRVVRYVNEVVDVVVKDNVGATVATFTAGEAAPAVEVRSPSFTGVDYSTGFSASGNPTTLKTVLDRWITSAGAIDFKVLVGGTAYYLQNALASLGSVFINVKGSPYNATGDGTTDDTIAIQAAINAADASGGIVFFPAGYYRITATLTCQGKASLMGVGPDGAAIGIFHATAALFHAQAATSYGNQVISGLRLLSSTPTNTGPLLKFAYSSAKWLVANCTIIGATGDIVTFEAGTPDVTFRDCHISINQPGSRLIYGLTHSLSKAVRLFGNTIEVVTTTAYAPTTAMVYCDNIIAQGNTIDMSLTGSSGATLLQNAGGALIATGNRFISPTGGDVRPFYFFGGGPFIEDNNSFSGAFASAYKGWSITDFNVKMVLGSRQVFPSYLTETAITGNATLAYSAPRYGWARTKFTSATGTYTQTISLDPGSGEPQARPGMRFTLVLWNASTFAQNIAFYGGSVYGIATSIAAGKWLSLEFVFAETSSTMGYWVLVAASTAGASFPA